MDANKLFTKFSIEKIWNKLKQHDKAMNSVLLILLPSNWVLQDGKYVNTVQYSGFKSSDKLTVDLYDDGNLADLQLTEYEHYIDGFEIIDGALVAIASVKPTQTMTVVVKGGFQANESEVGDLSVIEDELNVLGNRPVNNNLLINSNFANPVNQRGITPETWIDPVHGIYGIDRWINQHCTVSSITNGITLSGNGSNVSDLRQPIENGVIVEGKKYTLSACIDGKIVSGTVIANSFSTGETNYAYQDDSVNIFLFYSSTVTKSYNFYFRFKDTNTHTITWAKLELGEHATPYVPRLYAEELQLCMRYYQIAYMGRSKMYAFTASEFAVSYPLRTHMRIAPTVDFSQCVMLVNGNRANIDPRADGFSFILVGADYDNHIALTARKNSHGITPSDYPQVGGIMLLDAEL